MGTDYSDEVSVRLFDVSGKLYYSRNFIPQFGVIKVIPENLKVGVYLVDIQSTNFSHSDKLLYQPSFSSSFQLKQNEIEQAIMNIERNTSVEISFVAITHMDENNANPSWSSDLFYQLGMHRTQHRNALMVWWDERSGLVSFESDQRLLNSPAQKELQNVMSKYQRRSSENETTQLNISGLFEDIGTILENHHQSSERNLNEIPNYAVSW